jgi:hypothetical protein
MSVFQLLARVSDEGDAMSPLYAHWLGRDGGSANTPGRRVLLTRRYAFRGRARSAIASTDTATLHTSTESAGLALAFAQAGSITPATAARIFERVLRDKNVATLTMALPWWYHARDTMSLKRAAAIAHAISPKPPENRGVADYAEQSANAYLLLVRGDSAGAIQAFLKRPDSAMSRVFAPMRIDVARLLLARNQPRDAAAYLDARPPFPETATIWNVQWHLERARAARRLGDSQRVRSSYSVVALAWNHPDPEFQPFLAEAQSALRASRNAPAR